MFAYIFKENSFVSCKVPKPNHTTTTDMRSILKNIITEKIVRFLGVPLKS